MVYLSHTHCTVQAGGNLYITILYHYKGTYRYITVVFSKYILSFKSLACHVHKKTPR